MFRRAGGFTLVELLMLIMVIAVMAVSLSTRTSPLVPARLAGAGEKMIADMNHARRLAMTEYRRYAVDFTDASYRIRYIAADGEENGSEVMADVACPHTGHGEYARDFSGEGITLSADFNGTPRVMFGSFGRPFDAAGEELDGDGLVTLAYRGRTLTVRVVRETGSVIRGQ